MWHIDETTLDKSLIKQKISVLIGNLKFISALNNDNKDF